MNDFFLIIPAFEPDHTLLDFLKSMKEYTGEEGLPAPKILVVDDGSSEKCREIFQEAQAYGRVEQ